MNTLPYTAITASMLTQARQRAVADGRLVVEVLEELQGGTSAEFISALGELLSRPVLHMADIRAMDAAFDVLAFKESLAHDCLLLRDATGQLHLALDDPFDSDVLSWAEARIAQDFVVCLAHRSDIAAWQARHEEGLNAIDGALTQTEAASSNHSTIEELSFLAE